MFESFKRKKAEVIEHWISFAEDFQFSSSEFYTDVETEIKRREVPGLEMTRIDFSEGGLLSDKRVYLRMIRERLLFDICAAPFGSRFFFSCRMAEIPIVVQLWQLALVLGGFFALTVGLFMLTLFAFRFIGFFSTFFALLCTPFMFILSLAAVVYVLRNAIALGLKDLDATLIKSPIVGPMYELWFRKETYYRIDTRLMYLDTVSNVVKKLAEEVTGAKGIKLTRQYEHAPILGELYKPVQPRLEIK